MFEFKASYLEAGYHKPGEQPFEFPPSGTESTTRGNLIEIRGKNGTGKTTMLNILALALGYLDREEELAKKPLLKRKLLSLDQNETLEYSIQITRQEPDAIDLKLFRSKGQKPRASLNSKAVGAETIAHYFDVVFLTEDDPAKVISAGLGKLAQYFGKMDNRLSTMQAILTRYAIENGEFREFRQKEMNMLEEIESHRKNTEDNGRQLEDLKTKLKKVELRDEVKAKLELLKDQEKIQKEFIDLQEKHHQLAGKKDTEIADKIFRETIKLARDESLLKDNASQIMQICDSLAQYGVKLSPENLLAGDNSEFNTVRSGLQGRTASDASRTEMVEDFIRLLERYPQNYVVPVFEKPVRDVLMDFYKAKSKLLSDRVHALSDALGRTTGERQEIRIRQERIQEKLGALSQNRRDLERFDTIAKAFVEAEKKYISLQAVLQEDRNSILSTWAEVKIVSGDPETMRAEVQRLEVQKRAEENMMSRIQQKLSVLRDNASKKPRYFDQEKQLASIRATVTGLREKLYHWGRILNNPTASRELFESIKGQPGFGLTDHRQFVDAVGRFLGDQFEPVAFDSKLHGIKFLDIEENTFTTNDGRRIPIENLSQGQSKTTTITGSFKQMGQDKVKIVLVDEIADLDPENLANVKKILSERYRDGSLLLAVLVRPIHESSQKPVEIVAWS